jgi:hypothetical protein
MAPLLSDDTRYDSLDLDVDLENDDHSETTLASDGFLGKYNSSRMDRIDRHENNSRLRTIFTWSRWGIVVFLQGIIIMLLLPTSGVLSEGWSLKGLGSASGWDQSKTETGGDINGLYIPSK